MATRTRIVGVPVQDKHPVWVVDYILWWPMGTLIGNIGTQNAVSGFRESVDSTLYLDYVGIFNKEEFVRLNDDYKARFLADEDKKPLHAEQQGRMRDVDTMLKQHLDIKWILVEQYEWESGL